MREPIPAPVLSYGLLGLIPFLAAPLAAREWPDLADVSLLIEAVYAALIMSFLGGVRWGFAVGMPRPGFVRISASMAPTVAALGLLVGLAHWRALQLWGLAAALAAHWAWDRRAPGAPSWFPRLRAILTAGALAGLLGGAWVAA